MLGLRGSALPAISLAAVVSHPRRDGASTNLQLHLWAMALDPSRRVDTAVPSKVACDVDCDRRLTSRVEGLHIFCEGRKGRQTGERAAGNPPSRLVAVDPPTRAVLGDRFEKHDLVIGERRQRADRVSRERALSSHGSARRAASTSAGDVDVAARSLRIRGEVWRVGAGVDGGGDLGVLDDVGPVGEDPVAAGALGLEGGGECLGGVEQGELVAGAEAVDEVALVGRGGGEDAVDLVAAVEELVERAEPWPRLDRRDVAGFELRPCSQDLLGGEVPCVTAIWLEGCLADAVDVVGGLVLEPVLGDRADGGVPDRRFVWGVGSGAEGRRRAIAVVGR